MAISIASDTVHCMDCVSGMRHIPDNSIDCGLLSPPYDALRKYDGFVVDLHATGAELFRILKPGAVVTMVIQDQTADFAKSLTSFRTIVDWCDTIGFRLFECCIYHKYGTEGGWWNQRFRVDHEYMPMFLKGDRPLFFDKEHLKLPSLHAGEIITGKNRKTDGTTNPKAVMKINEKKCRGTVWDYLKAGDKDPIKRQHPAPFPDDLAEDIVRCFCPPNGVVIDPFMGSGTTAVAARRWHRHFIGFEVSEKYCHVANERLRHVKTACVSKTIDGLIPTLLKHNSD